MTTRKAADDNKKGNSNGNYNGKAKGKYRGPSLRSG